MRHRRKELAAIQFIGPAGEVEGDPPVVWKVPVVMGAEPEGILLELARTSGRGLIGSRLILAAREYDGTGPRGGEPRRSVTAHVVFRDNGGHLRRTAGVAIHASELRGVAAALTAEADRLDAAPVPTTAAAEPASETTGRTMTTTESA